MTIEIFATIALPLPDLVGRLVRRPHPPAPSPLRWRGGAGHPSPPLHRNGEGAGGWGFEQFVDYLSNGPAEAGFQERANGMPISSSRRRASGSVRAEVTSV